MAGVTFALPARPAAAQLDPGGPPPATADLAEGAQVLTRGPVHEAFAEPVVFDPRPGPVVPKEPPPPVEELPPDQRPEGTNVQWIPGYWAWDDTRNDFLWVSGLWRDLPPGRQWVPGYWGAGDGGYRWIPGAWTSTVQQDVQYYPVPPASLEAGPSSPPPSANSVWSPGYWDWQGDHFVWRPGFWVSFQPDWVWVPAHYVWTPNGCLFVDGYWDLPVVRRGTPFAPVYFVQPVVRQPRLVYTPTISLLASVMVTSLFVRPSYNQYYFGDYYAESDARAGILPWYSFHQSHRGYDPVFAHYSVVQARRDPRWLDRLRDDYQFRREHPEARPPHTYLEQQKIVNRTTVNNVNVTNVRTLEVARPLSQVATNLDQPLRFTRVDAARRQELTRQVEQFREFRQQRVKQELQAVRPRERANERDPARALAKSANPPGADARPRQAERFRSPIAAPAAPPLAGTNPGPRTINQGEPRNEARPQRLGQLKGQRQPPQLEPLKAQQERQQLEQQKAQRQREQREQLEPLKAQQQRQQLEQLKGQQREQMEQLKAQRQQMEQLKAQRQQHLEQLKAQQRPRGDGGERPQKKERD